MQCMRVSVLSRRNVQGLYFKLLPGVASLLLLFFLMNVGLVVRQGTTKLLLLNLDLKIETNNNDVTVLIPKLTRGRGGVGAGGGSTVQYSTVQYSTVQYTQCSAI